MKCVISIYQSKVWAASEFRLEICTVMKTVSGTSTGLPVVREKSGKKYFFKVSEKSGNFTKSQGIL